MIGLNTLTFTIDSYGETIQNASCIFGILVLIGYPLWVFLALKKELKGKNFN
jgi:hypothetical protein